MVATRDNFPLLAELLAEQQRLDTPVARFSAHHDRAPAGTAAFLPQQIPLTAPQPGEQYAFEVDLDSCTGCKSCVAACHALNGLDDHETWRDVGMIVSPSRARPFSQTITTACHHCEDPACLNGCPVLAYEKDPVTGIVRHLDDQCIGCSYCVLKCPYDVPKFSSRLGIVRKCDMCHGRLAAGEAPACAQACPTSAIRIVTVAVGSGRPNPESGDGDAASSVACSEATARISFAPPARVTPCRGSAASTIAQLPLGARATKPVSLPMPDPRYTRPTTRYVSKRTLPENLVAGDATRLRPQPAHWPLVIMLTLLPCAVAFSALAAVPVRAVATPTVPIALLAVGAGLAGLSASVFHLGQPLRAWRIFLGWRRSWLSREAMLFGAWFALAVATVRWPAVAPIAAMVGLAALACSAMIYVDTRRHFWRPAQTFPRFLGSACILAALIAWAPLAVVLYAGKLGVEVRTFFDGSMSARLQRGPLRRVSAMRDALAVITLILMVSSPAWVAMVTFVAGELAERYLFFRAVDAPKMPGMPT